MQHPEKSKSRKKAKAGQRGDITKVFFQSDTLQSLFRRRVGLWFCLFCFKTACSQEDDEY